MMEWVVTSGFLILVVLALRAALGKKISAGMRYTLWAVVLVRLLIPVSFFTLPAAAPQFPAWTPPEAMREESIYVLPVNIQPVESSDVRVLEDGSLGDPNSFGYPRLTGDGGTVIRYADKISPLELLGWIWTAGSVLFAAVLLAANLRFSARLRRVRRPLEGCGTPVPVYIAPALPSPCLAGLFRPAVYVTEEAAADPVMLRHVLAHELTHYNHRDHLWSVLRGAALAVHWWNPLVWLAVVCSRRDGELACDEGALKRLGDGERSAYGETLLALVTAKSRPADLLSFATTMTGGKRSLKERILRIAQQPKQLVSAMILVIAVLSLSALAAFGQAKAEPEPDVEPDIVEPSPVETWDTNHPDLDHDGIPDKLEVRQIDEDWGTLWKLEFTASAMNYSPVWEGEAATPHVGWTSFYLCRLEGEDYLLQYTPYMSGGGCYYHYKLFYLVPSGEEVVVQENEVEFDLIFAPEYADQHHFDPEAIAAFMSEINALLEKSELLINTDENLQGTFQQEGRLYDSLWWLDDDLRSQSEINELLTALRQYASYAADHPDDVNSALNDLLVTLESENIGSIDGDVTASELVYLLNKAAPNRLSRFHEYNRFVEEGAWMWSTAELTVSVENSGTLYLLACDSGDVELAYETADGCTSAFYDSEELYALVSKTGRAYPIEALPYSIDLDRDGIPEHLLLRSDLASMYWCLECRRETGEKTWSDEAATSHAGWNALFLCRLDGQDYLLRYHPDMSGGICSYQYQLFYLEEGREVVVQENSLLFDINFDRDFAEHHQFEPQAIASFMDEINALLENSVQLLNTNGELLNTFEREGRLYDNLWWLDDAPYDDQGYQRPSGDLLTALKWYASCASGHHDESEVHHDESESEVHHRDTHTKGHHN